MKWMYIVYETMFFKLKPLFTLENIMKNFVFEFFLLFINIISMNSLSKLTQPNLFKLIVYFLFVNFFLPILMAFPFFIILSLQLFSKFVLCWSLYYYILFIFVLYISLIYYNLIVNQFISQFILVIFLISTKLSISQSFLSVIFLSNPFEFLIFQLALLLLLNISILTKILLLLFNR